jgi:hypothetical protein
MSFLSEEKDPVNPVKAKVKSYLDRINRINKICKVVFGTP